MVTKMFSVLTVWFKFDFSNFFILILQTFCPWASCPCPWIPGPVFDSPLRVHRRIQSVQSECEWSIS